MGVLKRVIAATVTATIIMTSMCGLTAYGEDKTMDIIIDGSKANTSENKLYRGAGMVSANNSSRLLLDYKAENPEAYWEILNHIFSAEGIGVNHLKLEMGADINSSSGTEPTVKRTEDEKADATRGAGYQLAADAKTINPDLTLDMLFWSEPLWVTNAEDVNAARYKWYKETLDAAYETYGIKFDYVSAVRNERAYDAEWIKYLSKSLKAEKDCPYDYSQIKIVGGDEVCSWNIAEEMAYDKELLDAIDVIGSHYTSWSSDTAKKLAAENGKELWFSEACAPMSYAQGTYRFDDSGSGMNDINGLLDIANRIITMYPGGYMTLYEYQPVVAAYYDGVTYCQKQLITANTPWSGYYYLDGGYYMSLHFSQFIKKGWAFVDDACYGDGVAGGDGHAIVDAQYSYITATDTNTDDYSTVITNTTSEPITYNITVKNLDKASSSVYVWETRGPEGGQWNENYFRNVDTITPTEKDGAYTYSVTVKPYSLVTLSTVERNQEDYQFEEGESELLQLPYTDDFEYSDYEEGYLASRGYAPRYTTDQGGAFEVCNVDGNNLLTQMITPEIKAEEWGGTPDPTTNFGDDRWYNYSMSADVILTSSDTPAENYAGIGARYNLGSAGASGYRFVIYENGDWSLNKYRSVLGKGTLDGFDSSSVHNLKLTVVDNKITAVIDGNTAAEVTDNFPISAGRAALYSSYNKNSFDNVKVEPVENTETYIRRYDNTDLAFNYSGSWTHNTMDSFRNYKRTVSDGEEGAEFTFDFTGTGFALTGVNKNDVSIEVELDGEVADTNYNVKTQNFRSAYYFKSDLENKEHTVRVKVLSGTLSIDSAQITGAYAHNNDSTEKAVEKTSEAGKKRSILPIAAGAAAVAAAAAAAVVIRKKRKKN